MSLGFDAVGISKATFLEEDAVRLEKWLNENRHGSMTYMENYFDMRVDPTKLVPGAQSVISLMLNYFPEQSQVSDSFKISKYAYGRDYHHVIKNKLKSIQNFITSSFGEVSMRGFVDSAPVLDKAWAKKSGLGWIGKNANLIHPKKGSFFFLAEIILDLKLDPDNPITDHCGTCNKCVEACPTDAIYEPYKVDGSKCISFLTIELKEDQIPDNFSGLMEDWVFGCDICQDVCPWNKFSSPHKEADFLPHPELLSLSKKDWQDLDQLTFNEIFRKSAVKRTKFSGLSRNISFVSKG